MNPGTAGQERRRRVLLYPCFYFPEAWNGMTEHMLVLTSHLKRLGYEPAVVGRATDGEQTQSLADRAEIPLVDLAGGLLELARVIRRQRIDILHVHTPVLGGQLPVIVAARLAGAACAVVTVHQIQPERLPARTRLLNRWLGRIARVIAVSPAVRASLSDNAGLGEARVQVILNGIDEVGKCAEVGEVAELPAPPRARLRAGCFGRLSPEKGLDLVLEALALVPESAVDLVVVGDGPQRQELEEQAGQLGLSGRVQFLGYRRDARRLMTQVDVVVHVPRYEGFGLVVLEAMCAGRPVIVNDAPGGMAETVVADETGLVAAAGSPVALADGLLALASSPLERARMGDAGRERFRTRFRASVMAESVAAVYTSVLGGRSVVSPG